MIIVLKENPEQKQLDNLVAWLKSMDLDIHYSQYGNTTIMTKTWKKAYVTLTADSKSIEFFEGMV